MLLRLATFHDLLNLTPEFKLHCQVLAIDSLGSSQLKAMLHCIYSVVANWDGIYDNDAGI